MNKNYIDYISELYNALRKAFFSKNIGFSVIRLIFLKYASDNCLGANTREEMQDYMRVQRIFAARDISGGPNGLVPVLHLIDKHYNLDGIVKNSINEYAKDLFGLDESWIKKNTSDKEFVEIMSVLSNMDLTDDINTHEVGMALVLNLIDNLQYHGENVKLGADFYSRRELGTLVNKILQVEDGDVFLDFCSGIGTTTISAVGNRRCRIINADVYEESLSVAAMLYIMCGYVGFEIKNQDSFLPYDAEMNVNAEENELADKIFVDPPILKIKENDLRDSALISLRKAIFSLKENGTAVVTVPASTLFTKFKGAQKFREELLGCGYIQSVVALPFTYTRTTVTMYLVVLSKKHNREVLFANFTPMGIKTALDITIKNSARFKGGNLLSEADLETIANVIVNGTEIEGVSRFVSPGEIANNEFDLTPARYVTEVIETEDISLKEIDDELNLLYEKLLRTHTR